MDSIQIKSWVTSLIQSFGEPHKVIDPIPLEKLHREHRYTEMVGVVAKQMRLSLQIRVGLVNAGGPDAPAWVTTRQLRGIYGTAEFNESRITLYLRRSFLECAPFTPVVMGIAHELSHVVLNATFHPLRREEKVVDLTAMLFGYRGLWHNIHSDVAPQADPASPHFGGTLMRSYGYLSSEEIAYAKLLMRT